MKFDRLRLVDTTSILGDGSEAKVYEIKMDRGYRASSTCDMIISNQQYKV